MGAREVGRQGGVGRRLGVRIGRASGRGSALGRGWKRGRALGLYWDQGGESWEGNCFHALRTHSVTFVFHHAKFTSIPTSQQVVMWTAVNLVVIVTTR